MNHRPDTIPTDVAQERRWLGGIVLLALAVRLPLLLTPGYDVVAYKIWARVVAAVGIGGAYGAAYPDEPGSAPYHYGPFYLYILRATGSVYTALRPGGDWHDQFLAALLKSSPIAAELLLGVILWRFLRARVSPRAALLAAAAYLFTPGLIWNTAYWGGIDAFQALFITLALMATTANATALAWPLAALAVGVKLTAFPGVLAIAPVALPRRPARLAAATRATGATALLLLAPILARGQAATIPAGIFGHLGIYAQTTFNTHNIWRLLAWGQGTTPDTTLVAPGVDYRLIGRALAIIAAAPALWLLWRHPGDTPRLFATSAYLTFAFCILTTGVHENWAYSLFAPLLVAAALDRRYRPLYAALTVTFFLNLALQDPPLFGLLGDAMNLRARPLRIVNSVAQCAFLLWWAWLLVGQTLPRRASGTQKSARTLPAE